MKDLPVRTDYNIASYIGFERLYHRFKGFKHMVEKKIELKRRRARAKKLTKLKTKLGGVKDGRDRDEILKKIHRISPWWTEAGK